MLRRGSEGKKPLKEKILLLYDAVFKVSMQICFSAFFVVNYFATQVLLVLYRVFIKSGYNLS